MPPGPDDTSPAPAYRLSIAIEGGLLRAQVDGEIDAQAVRLAYWREIVDTARAHQCRLLLVIDRKKTRPASSAELAALALAFRAHRDDFDRIGVYEPTAVFVPTIEHAEIHGRALGINVRIFSDPVEAERWVRFGSADD